MAKGEASKRDIVVGSCSRLFKKRKRMKPSLNNLKKSPDCMLWFSWGFLTTSALQEEQHGGTQTSQETWSVLGTIFYLSAGQNGVGYSRSATLKEVLRRYS